MKWLQTMTNRRPRLAAASVLGAVAVGLACTGDQDVERPNPPYGPIPIEYPMELWDQDVEGRTLLRVRVTEVGSVDSVQIVESSGHLAFDLAAASGAKEMRFDPARRNGKRVEVWARVPVLLSKRPRPPGSPTPF